MFRVLFKKNKQLPDFFKPILWSYNFEKIDLEKHKERIIINTLNYGDLKHWRWIIKNYGKDGIVDVLKRIPVTELRPHVLSLVSIIFSFKDFNYALRGAKR